MNNEGNPEESGGMEKNEKEELGRSCATCLEIGSQTLQLLSICHEATTLSTDRFRRPVTQNILASIANHQHIADAGP